MSAEELQVAMEGCAQEPIHIPGVTQPFGVLLGVRMSDFAVLYASENTADIFGLKPEEMLGQTIEALMGPEVKHSLGNAMVQSGSGGSRNPAGTTIIRGERCTLHVSGQGQIRVVEVEPCIDEDMPHEQQLHTITALMGKFQAAESSKQLMDSVVRVFQTLSGCDRVMAYRFDSDGNGEIVAEAKKRSVETFLGLRFPKWDIPKQCHAMMIRLPLRMITDVQQTPVKLLAMSPDLPPLDISYAHLRGVSQIHMQYLTNMGVHSTMTLSVLIDDRLWGMISFHHRHPRVPSNVMRRIYCVILPLINTKLQALLNKEALDLNHVIDSIRKRVQAQIENDVPLEETLDEHVSRVLEDCNIQGIMVCFGGEQSSHGQCPPAPIIEKIRALARDSEEHTWSTSVLPEAFGMTPQELNGVCGAMCLDQADGRSISLFRTEQIRTVNWAGAPEKETEIVDGIMRLTPRGSFAHYAETVQNQAAAWLPQDQKLLENIAHTLIAANQRRMAVAAMRRQQDLIVDELNHRVRNILSLVRSISRQARHHNSSLESYSHALEQRMNALAVAHDLGTGKSSGPVPVQEILRLEAEPYSEGRPNRVVVRGDEFHLTPEAAPIMALVIHELMTNAAKYGALSNDEGHVEVDLTLSPDGAGLHWAEFGGPPVVTPNAQGFGTTLITQAIPYELSGESELQYSPGGVQAQMSLPRAVIGEPQSGQPVGQPTRIDPVPVAPRSSKPVGGILVLEDNFMIATDMSQSLDELGYHEIEIAANLVDGRTALAENDISMAILDINLGRGGTSIELARELEERGTPFVFVTGYGEVAPLPEDLSHVKKLQKPVAYDDLRTAVEQMSASIKTS